MNDQVIALVGAAILGFIVRFMNVVLEWLAKFLKVTKPDAIARPVGESFIDRKH